LIGVITRLDTRKNVTKDGRKAEIQWRVRLDADLKCNENVSAHAPDVA